MSAAGATIPAMTPAGRPAVRPDTAPRCGGPLSIRRRAVVLALAVSVLLTATVTSRSSADSATGPMTVKFPTGTHQAGAHLDVTGTVTGTSPREIDLQIKGSNGTWVPMAATTSAADGTFTVRAPTWWVASQVLRVDAPATGTDPEATSVSTAALTITRTYTPRHGTAHTWLLGTKYRWNPCTVHNYRVTAHRLPADGLKLIRWALGQVSQATGLRFHYAGKTPYVPFKNSLTNYPNNTDFVFGWATPAQVPNLAGAVAGYGDSVGNFAGASKWMSDGQVAFDLTTKFPAASRRGLRENLALHELGHAIGLGHVTDKRQIMYPAVRDLTPRYGGGDLRGLAALGASGGCLTLPPGARTTGHTWQMSGGAS